jgi:hypothetical protein
MSLDQLARQPAEPKPPRRTRPAASFRPRLESLEDRATPATFAVTTALDVVDPADGKVSLREAVNRANKNTGADTIVLPAGVFKIAIDGADDTNAGGDFDLTNTVTVRGAGADLTVIDGQQKDRVFDVIGSLPHSFRLVVQGLTVRNGNVTGSGGGVQVANADLVLRDCVVSGNRASLTGGGVSNAAAPGTGNVTLVGTTVARNAAGSGGGGLDVQDVKGAESVLTVTGSTVRRNVAGGNGGGIEASTATVTNSTVSGNTAGNGGGIEASTATVTNSTVSGNTAGNGGGIEANTATVTNSTVSGNTATSGNGGGIEASTATLTNCTVAENVAHTGGGLFRAPFGTFTLKNTIVALNLTDSVGTGPDVAGDPFTSAGHNLIGDGTGDTGFTNGVNGDIVGTAAAPIDPRLGALASNGGRTKTMALLAGSPAIDRGDNTVVNPVTGLPVTIDQRGTGFARKKDGNGDGISVVDIGAFER